MDESTYVYLSSNGSRNIYPSNHPHSFENHIQPISFSPNKKFEVGLVNIIYPLDRLTIVAGDYLYGASIYFKNNIKGIWKEVKYIPTISISANETKEGILDQINQDIARFLSNKDPYLSTSEVNELGNDGKIISFDKFLNKCFLLNKVSPSKPSDEVNYLNRITDISIFFQRGLADVLGFDIGRNYSLREKYIANDFKIYGTHAFRCDGGVNSLFIYSDICERIRFSTQMTNILCVYSLDSIQRGGTLYHDMEQVPVINSIGILIKDHRGFPVKYPKNTSVILVLHIRPKPSP